MLSLALALVVLKPVLTYAFYGEKEIFHLDSGVPAWDVSMGSDYLVYDDAVRHDGGILNSYRTHLNVDSKNADAPYISPPLLHWFYSWVTLMSQDDALHLWLTLCFVFMALLFFLWLEYARKGGDEVGTKFHNFLITVLFLISYPALFALERGQNDILILMLYTLALMAFLKNAYFLAGVLSTITAFVKVYPTFVGLALSLAALGLLFGGFRRQGLKLILGQCVGLAVCVIPFWKETVVYIRDVVPNFFVTHYAMSISHSLKTTWGIFGIGVGVLLWAAAAGCFFVCWRRMLVSSTSELKQALVISWAHLVAISVYLTPYTFDYNLILVIPLLAMVIHGKGPVLLVNCGVLFFGLGYALPRWTTRWFESLGWDGSGFMALQIIGLGFLTLHLIQKIRGMHHER